MCSLITFSPDQAIVIAISGNSIRWIICFGCCVFSYARQRRASVGEVLQRVQHAGGDQGGAMGAVNITASACQGAGVSDAGVQRAGRGARVTAR